jgi:hypothetical protein
VAAAWQQRGTDSAAAAHLLKNQPKAFQLRQKRHSEHPATRESHLSSGIMNDFEDNEINGIVAFEAHY